MADISEAEAILHLKRALGEIDANDAIPPPLPPRMPKPTPPALKSRKLEPPDQVKLPAATPVQPSIGPTPKNELPRPSPQPVPSQTPPMESTLAATAPVTRGSTPMVGGGQPFGAASLTNFLSGTKDGRRDGVQFLVRGLPAGMAPGILGMPPSLANPVPPNPVAAALEAAGPGKTSSSFQIPQSKVALVLGRNNATLNAIRAYAKAVCIIEQHVPEDDQARVTAIGSGTEIEKCKQTVLAVVDGSMSVSTLFTLAGVPMPRGGSAECCAAMPPPMPLLAGGALAPSILVPGLTTGVSASVPGMPENSQMQQNLNDYYARWWSTYATQQETEERHAMKVEVLSGGFDKDALARLAEKAAAGMDEPEEPPPPPPDVEVLSTVFPLSDAADQFSQQVLSTVFPSSDTADQFSQQAGVSKPSNARGPITLKGFLRPAEPQKPKKDEDSVQKMLERLQGNIEQTKQAAFIHAPSGQVPPHGGFLGPSGEEDDIRSRVEAEFDSLISRVQAAATLDEIENVGREVLMRFSALNPQQIATFAKKLEPTGGVASYQNGDLLAELVRMASPRLREFNSNQFTTLTSTFAAWSRNAERKRNPRFADASKAYFDAASIEMSSRLMMFLPCELNCCLAAFVSVGFCEHRFFASVGRAALARHSSFAPVQLTALLAILSEMRLVHTDLFNAAAAFLATRVRELRPVDIIRVLRSFAKCNLQSPVLCKAVSDEVVSRARMKANRAQFKAEDLCEIGWALCVLQHYHEGLFRLMFKTMEKSPTIACDALLQVYEVHLVLDNEFRDAYANYRLTEKHVVSLEEHYREIRKDERRCSERQRNDVASVLKSLVDGSVHVNHRTSSNLLVDVAALKKRSSTEAFIHVDLDSSVTVVRSLDQEEPSIAPIVVEGPVALRRRILKGLGLKFTTVRESEWRDLDDSKEKRRYLRTLLSNMGDVLL